MKNLFGLSYLFNIWPFSLVESRPFKFVSWHINFSCCSCWDLIHLFGVFSTLSFSCCQLVGYDKAWFIHSGSIRSTVWVTDSLDHEEPRVQILYQFYCRVITAKAINGTDSAGITCVSGPIWLQLKSPSLGPGLTWNLKLGFKPSSPFRNGQARVQPVKRPWYFGT